VSTNASAKRASRGEDRCASRTKDEEHEDFDALVSRWTHEQVVSPRMVPLTRSERVLEEVGHTRYLDRNGARRQGSFQSDSAPCPRGSEHASSAR